MTPEGIRLRALALLTQAPELDPVELARLCGVGHRQAVAALEGDGEARFIRTAGPAESAWFWWKLDPTAAGGRARARLVPLTAG